MTLTEFLLDRIAEDEAAARDAGAGVWTVECWAGGYDAEDMAEHLANPGEHDHRAITGDDFHIYDEGGHDAAQAQHIARHDPARVLKDCEAKRRIVGTFRELRQQASALHYAGADEGLITTARNMYAGLDIALRYLALPYAGHPDYDQEWEPTQ